MGTIHNHVAVAVVGEHTHDNAEAAFETVKEFARELTAADYVLQSNFESLLIGPVPSIVNSYLTYIMLPDGSKEGWGTSADADRLREFFVETMSPFTFGGVFVGSWGEWQTTGEKL